MKKWNYRQTFIGQTNERRFALLELLREQKRQLPNESLSFSLVFVVDCECECDQCGGDVDVGPFFGHNHRGLLWPVRSHAKLNRFIY